MTRSTTGRRGRGTWLLAAGLAMVAVLSGCTSSGHKAAPSSAAPADPAAVTVVAGKATTLDLGGGADLIIPPGAMTPGATVRATYKGNPGGKWNSMSPTSNPVELISDPADAIHGLLTLEFPVPATTLAAGIDPATAFGVSTYDAASKTWTPFASTYDSARHMIVAQIPHFSWWNPFTWDWGKLWASVVQGFGQLVGTRSGPAQCTGNAPSWVQSVTGISNDANVAIHACAQSQGDVLDVEFVNNRPYTQILTYGGGVKWGWHDDDGSVLDHAASAAESAAINTPTQLLIPAGGRASVGIVKTPAGQPTVWRIGPTGLTVAVDLLDYVLGTAAPMIFDTTFGVVGCIAGVVTGTAPDISPGGLRNILVKSFNCVKSAFGALLKHGALDSVKVDNLNAIFGAIDSASVVAGGLQLVGGTLWRVGDFITDWLRYSGSPQGAGFTVTATPTPPTTTPVAGPPTVGTTGPVVPPPGPTTHYVPPPAPSSTYVPPPTPQPVNAYDNYGPANAGRAMCRGNPGNGLSMPGGTASQTFVVPNGVASLSSAMVQIDPDSTVTANLQIAVNGNVVASTATAAAGDTHFSFGPVGVSPGQTVTLSITFTATYGKIITVYTAGSPGGTFTASNSCPDGAPNVSTGSTGLRAVVSGMS